MDHFHYRHGELYCEQLPVQAIADQAGTPSFIYSARTALEHASRLRAAFAPIDPMLCYAVKACSNLQILRLLTIDGLGMDVVSGIELERAWLAGCPMERVVFAGVGKCDAEIRAALDGRYSPFRNLAASLNMPDPALRGPVGVLNAESRSELELIASIAEELGLTACVAIRLNPDIDAGAHDHTTTGRSSDKFGVPFSEAVALCRDFRCHTHARIVGFHVHLGSPIYRVEPYKQAIDQLRLLIEAVETAGTVVTHLDLGGGIGADYFTGQTPPYDHFAQAIIPAIRDLVDRGVRIVLEPGRTIMGNAGILVVAVRHIKRQGGRRFVICDAGMNALIRPSLYNARHFVWPVHVNPKDVPTDRNFTPPLLGEEPCDIVGPVCESGDFLARGVRLPEVGPGDLLAVYTAGAYGMTMSSTYNDKALPAEILVQNNTARLIRQHQQPIELVAPSLTSFPLDLPCTVAP